MGHLEPGSQQLVHLGAVLSGIYAGLVQTSSGEEPTLGAGVEPRVTDIQGVEKRGGDSAGDFRGPPGSVGGGVWERRGRGVHGH